MKWKATRKPKRTTEGQTAMQIEKLLKQPNALPSAPKVVRKLIETFDQEDVDAMLAAFTPDELRQWCQGLGIDTFVGSSGRVFPQEMKAAPLLRAWLSRLRQQGVRLE